MKYKTKKHDRNEDVRTGIFTVGAALAICVIAIPFISWTIPLIGTAILVGLIVLLTLINAIFLKPQSHDPFLYSFVQVEHFLSWVSNWWRF